MNEIERAYYVSEIYLPEKAKKKQETERALQEMLLDVGFLSLF